MSILAEAASALGTLWFVILVGVVSFGAGVWACPYVMKSLGKHCHKK
mgnify:CR=1 FL=1